MTANKWYCIAQTTTFDTSCGITIYSEGVAISFTTSVRFGSSSINIASCVIDGDILLSVRLRETDNKWCIDLLCNTEFNPTIDITDSPYWEVQNTPAGTGSILAIINDISKEFNTGIKGGESLWQLFNFGTQEKPEYAVVPKDYDGKPIGVVSKTFISFGGHNSGAGESGGTGGGITTFDVYIGNNGPYSLVNGRVDLPAYPTANLTGYATENWVKEQGYLTQHQDISHLLGKEEAKDIYATIIALNEVSDRVETIESIIGIDSKGNVYIKKKADGTARDFYTYGAISFGGNGQSSGSGEVVGSSVQYNASVTSGKLLGTLVINGVDNKIYAPAIPTKLSAFTNDEGYATEDWVNGQGFLTEHQSLTHLLSKEEAAGTYQPKGDYAELADLGSYLTINSAKNTYATKAALNNAIQAHDELREEFDALNGLLTDDTSGYIDTWNEVKSFLDGYSESQDLATILSGMNKDIANRATIEALNGVTTRIISLETTLSTEQGYIDTLQGYFTDGKAKKAIADGNGNNIVDTYATKVALNTTNTSLDTLSKEFSEFKELVNSLWYLDPDHANTVRTKLNVVVEQAISFGGYGESSGSGGGLTSFKVKVGSTTYTSVGDTVSIPAYPTKVSLGLGNVTNLAASGYLTDLSSNSTNAVSITVGGTTKNISVSTLKTSLGLGALAYKSSLLSSDIPSLDWSKITSGKPTTLSGYGIANAYTKDEANGKFFGIDISGSGIDAVGIINLNKGGYGYATGGWWGSGPALAFGSSNGYTALIQQGANTYTLHVSYKSNGGDIQEWKTLAFTESNVLSAQNLKHSNGTLGATVSSAGNVGIGTTEPSYKLDVRGIIHTSERLNVYKWSGTTLQGGLYALIDSSNVCQLNLVSASQAASLRNKDFNISNYTGGNITLVRADQWSASQSAIRIMKDSAAIMSSPNKGMRYLVSAEVEDNSEIGYFEVIGMNFAITSKEETLTTMTGVTFDWKKDTNNLELSRVYYDETTGKASRNDFNLKINGNLVTTGSITFGSASDRRLKDNIKSMTDEQALAVLSALNPVTFSWNSTAYELGKLSGVSDGFIADEYEELIPNSGRDIWANYRAINYERATGYLVKGWQNHETRLEKAERRIKELENELKQYRRA